MATAVFLTTLEVARTARDGAEVVEQTELAKSAIGPSGIITALQNERTWLAVELVGQQDQVTTPVRGYDETRAQTDAAVEAFRERVEGHGDVVADAYRPGLDGLGDLEEVRAAIDDAPGPRDLSNIEFANSIFGRYVELIEPFFEGTSDVALAIDDPELRRGAMLAEAVGREVELLSQLLTRTINDATVSEGGIDQPAEIITIAMLQSDFRRYAGILREAEEPYADLARERFPEDLTARVDEQVTAALDSGRVDLPVLLAAVDVPADEGLTGYMTALHDRITDRADHVRSEAEARQLRIAVLAVMVLASALGLTVLVSRSITRPLRSLTGQVKQMAERRLPEAVRDILETPLGDDVRVPPIEPVMAHTRDEVADMAAALNVMQESALDLAVEQAVLRRNIADSFVHLGRRNQNLLGRQLDFITELEAKEADADALASLFKLDHLATRMRRNAESLLVLAGVEPPRQRTAPVRLNDVVRAALGEVEDYHRVTVHGVEHATVTGAVAADLAHLIAELLENSLTFSPPDQPVEVRGRMRRDGGYQLAMVDRGTGMPSADIAKANRRLGGTEAFTVAPSKYLGHYVAGKLAARHGITLRLDPTPGHGITTTIDIPDALLVAGAPTPGGGPWRPRPVPAPAPHDPWAPAPEAEGALPPAGPPPGRNASTESPPAATAAPWGSAEEVAPAGPWGWSAGSGPAHASASTPSAPAVGPEPRRDASFAGAGGRPARAQATQSMAATWAYLEAREPRPAPAPPPVPFGPASEPSSTTDRRLTRRVPGTQLPTTQPTALRRAATAPPTGPAGPAPRRSGPARRVEAGDVYGFLSAFDSGVQLGLDEARRADTT